MAQEFGIRTREQAIADPGFFRLGNGYWRDDKVGGHGMVNLPKSIAVSCNTYYYQLGAEVDIDEWSAFMRQFGFGQKTGVDIEGEQTGTLPTREWKARRFPKDPKVHVGDQVSLGIGQGFNAFTPLQLAYATAILANNGVAFKPHLVKRIQDTKSNEGRLTQPEPAYTIKLKPEHIQAVKEGLQGVVLEGTSAAVFKGAKYTSGGKTGTAQAFNLRGQRYVESEVDERSRDHSWYITFAPLDKPQIALAVFVENGGFGARAAAPIARKVLDAYFDPAILEADWKKYATQKREARAEP
jgi:penicillin-binding protein 2